MSKGKKKIVDLFYKTIWREGEAQKVPYEFSSGEKELYINVCESVPVWGGIPLDVPWATSTNSYQQALKLINHEQRNFI